MLDFESQRKQNVENGSNIIILKSVKTLKIVLIKIKVNKLTFKKCLKMILCIISNFITFTSQTKKNIPGVRSVYMIILFLYFHFSMYGIIQKREENKIASQI